MNFIFLAFTILMVASFASASTNSTRANTEATKYRTDFEKRVKAAINKVIPAFDKSASDAEASYRLQRKALYAQCTALGSDGVTLGAKYETAIKVYEYAIPSLVNKTTLKANITKILADFNTNIFSPATKNITAMVAAISKYPKAIACWDDNSNDVHLQEDTKAFSLENVISYIISSTAQYIQSSIDELSYYLNMWADEAQTQCTTDKKCKLAYYKDPVRYASILAKFLEERDRLVEYINYNIDSIIRYIVPGLQDSTDTFNSQVNTIAPCVDLAKLP